MSDSQPLSAATSASQPSAPNQPAKGRIMALDALRGFDMFWIVGGEEVIHALYKALPLGLCYLLHVQMEHKAWQGIGFYDLIFPLFVFIVGVSLVFSLSKAVEQGGKGAAMKRIIVRSLVLYAFGLLVYGGISKGFDQVRWLGVLQRIALAYLCAGLIFCTFRLRGMVLICVALLLGYWAVTALVPGRDFNLEKQHLTALNLSPDAPQTREMFLATTNKVRGRYEDGLNLPQQVDFLYLPGYKWDGAYDPEGLLSTFPAVGTCLLGVFAGLLLRGGSVPSQKKVWYLLAAGIGGVLVGFIWGTQFPVIKKIWTSSYVLVAAGYSCILLAVFYQIIEIWQWRKWCIPFVWVGMNPITIYLTVHFVDFRKIVRTVVGGPIEEGLGQWGSFAVACAGVALMLAVVRFLYNRKIFLRL